MPYDKPTAVRAILRIAKLRGMDIDEWCLRAGIGKRTLYQFVYGDTQALKVDSAVALAEAADVSLYDLLGIKERQDASGQLALAMIEQIRRSYEASDNALRALAEILGDDAPAPDEAP